MTRDELIQGLNLDLANEYKAIITYIANASVVSGLKRKEMKEFFLLEVPDELRHALFLANKIAAMGGKPAVEPAAVPFTSDLKWSCQ